MGLRSLQEAFGATWKIMDPLEALGWSFWLHESSRKFESSLIDENRTS